MAESKKLLNFPSDKNGCGFYRTIIPLGYLSAKLEWDTTFMYQFVFDLNLVRMSDWIRFQRQCTDNQMRCIWEYRNCIDKTGGKSRLAYELDDLVHGIEPHNVLAYQFYTPKRRENVVNIMKMSNVVTFSTPFLKDFYQQNFGINHSVVIPNFLPKFLWNPTFTDKSVGGKKPTVVWAGSASHCGPGGDLEFMIPMIEATVDEFDWLFIGVVPEKLKGKVRFMPWVNFWEYPSMMQTVRADCAIAPITDTIFNMAKSDLKYKEFAAMNIPIICSSIGNGKGPYDLANAPLLVQNDPDAFYTKIKEVTENAALKADVLAKQRAYVEQNWFENQSSIDLYDQTYR